MIAIMQNKPQWFKILLGIMTVSPVLYMMSFFFLMPIFIYLTAEDNGSTSGPPIAFLLFFFLNFILIFWAYALAAIYIVNIFRNDRVMPEKKALWAVVVFLGSSIAQIVYWYLYIWREPEARPKAL